MGGGFVLSEVQCRGPCEQLRQSVMIRVNGSKKQFLTERTYSTVQ